MSKMNDIMDDPFNQEFCAYLEYHLTDSFKYSEDKNVQDLWCDGISHDALSKSQKSLNDTRRLETTAWIGTDGQDIFKMIIKFGPAALSNYSKGLDLKPCVPPRGSFSWINIDTSQKTIELQLK